MKTVYLASPLGFSEAGRRFMYSDLIPAIRNAGVETVLDPWKLTPESEIAAVQEMPYGAERRDAWRSLNGLIGSRNATAIRQADAVIAILDGVDIDSGTASEIGYAYGLGHRIVGYRGDFRMAGDNEGAAVNLQVEYFIYDSGGSILFSLDDLVGYIQEPLQKENL